MANYVCMLKIHRSLVGSVLTYYTRALKFESDLTQNEIWKNNIKKPGQYQKYQNYEQYLFGWRASCLENVKRDKVVFIFSYIIMAQSIRSIYSKSIVRIPLSSQISLQQLFPVITAEGNIFNTFTPAL